MNSHEIRKVINLLQHANPNLRRAAALALGREKADSAAGPLAKALRDPVWQVREMAARGMGAVGAWPGVFEALAGRLGVTEDNARSKVLEALSRSAPPPEPNGNGDSSNLGGRSAGGSADQEDHWMVRQALALALARARPDLIEGPLLQALESEQPSVKIAAMSGLVSLGSPEAAGRILPLCDHDDPQVQRAAAVALGKLRARSAASKLIEMCESAETSIRVEAVIALNHLKADEAFDALVARLVDQDAKVRAAAALAVGNTRRAKGVERVAALLNDPAPEARSAACRALETLNATDQAQAVGRLLLDGSPQVQMDAARAYARLAA